MMHNSSLLSALAPPITPSDLDTFSTAVFDTVHLPDRWVAFNKIHSSIKRVTTELFRVDFPGLETTLISASTIRLYTEYNVALCTRDEFPGLIPTYYRSFAQSMNRFDGSGYGWAYVDNATQTIVWDDSWSIADPHSFGVLDFEVHERYLNPGDIAASQAFFDNAERLQHQQQQRENRYFQQRVIKRSKSTAGNGAFVATKEAMDTFARRRKRLADADAADAAAAAASQAAAADADAAARDAAFATSGGQDGMMH
ncbi:hypothetical protein B0H17DRAFT_1142393 [Mycena rosella]|uniref:Uncharacterized protein n=1 Tax=Mycena rosella TaxID=1033263 RepID=A0AAD7CYP6_MYCRO|nr:hypothetical protein B0H17DRAFT_1142393 [Mycena rosella]